MKRGKQNTRKLQPSQIITEDQAWLVDQCPLVLLCEVSGFPEMPSLSSTPGFISTI